MDPEAPLNYVNLQRAIVILLECHKIEYWDQFHSGRCQDGTFVTLVFLCKVIELYDRFDFVRKHLFWITFPEAFVNSITINRVFFHYIPLQTPLSKWELQFWTFSVCKFPPPKLTCSVCYIINRMRVTNASGSYLDWLFKLSSPIGVHSKAEMLT